MFKYIAIETKWGPWEIYRVDSDGCVVGSEPVKTLYLTNREEAVAELRKLEAADEAAG